MSLTIQETIRQLHSSLQEYIEATYHIGSPALISQRKKLLRTIGVIHQAPYLESTPRYRPGSKFSAIPALPKAALELYEQLAQVEGDLPALLYNPPYKHQSDSILHALVEGKNLVVMTGTGSGKTESFLLPILGKLAREARACPDRFREQTAVRALILYPMNALVNDQLGRLRSLFGDPRTVRFFKGTAGRPARFARYTSRTPYAGIRTREKDSRKLMPFDDFYVEIQRQAQNSIPEVRETATRLLRQLKERGKWPAKPNLVAWFGDKGSEWQDRRTRAFRRAVMLPDDVELVTRHEVQAAAPDLLVTNYSMLEYMLMRPVERTIFDSTGYWLQKNPEESFLIVLDEAHLYRGAAGAEVGLLLRRLRDRLGIPPGRFQVICATASFSDAQYAPEFGSQLSGVPAETFIPVEGDYAWREHAGPGSPADAEVLATIDLARFYDTEVEVEKLQIVAPLLKHRETTVRGHLEGDLYEALKDFPPLGLLINSTMKQARPIAELGAELFPGTPSSLADIATTVLMALGSIARIDPKGAGLLPCRIHNFFRGLPGLWVCMDVNCSAVTEQERSGICGKLFGQPREQCECGARVLEFYTCRHCGTAYARAYTDDVDSPGALWPEPGRRLRLEGTETSPLLPLDLLLEEPNPNRAAEPADYDLETGRLNPAEHGSRMRRVHLRPNRDQAAVDEDGEATRAYELRGQYVPCACCGKTASYARSSVQDHQTKGDQPFQALVSRQIQIQPPGPKATRFAPLRGRKVLVFSDSRQVAARLAPNLQMYSTRDSLRPLIAWGFRLLQQVGPYASLLNLNDLYLAVLLASKKLKVRLRPELKASENFAAEDTVDLAVEEGAADTDAGLQFLITKMRSESPPQALLEDIITTVQDPFIGLEALAIASLCERGELTSKLTKLPPIPGVAETSEAKIALARAWLRCWRNYGFWLANMPTTWWKRPSAEGVSVKGKKGKGKFDAVESIVKPRNVRKLFHDTWTPELLAIFTTDLGGEYQLRGSELSLLFDGEWSTCATCRSVHRPVPGLGHCLDCGSQEIRILDPDTDAVFLARRGYYRRPVMAALAQPPQEPMALIAAEHTAQLNSAQNEDVFSKAEENELLFQDVAPALGRRAHRVTAIDVLSSTTTMEVGIDIGALSGVSLRNMPPGRANYQQRAGRAGRRANAVATVIAFGSADSHDEHYFTAPDEMIGGKVIDPKLTLENRDIVRRHIRAYLLQNYHQDRIPNVDPAQPHDLFSVLGSVAGFRSGKGVLNIADFKTWITEKERELRGRIEKWIPTELPSGDRSLLLSEMRFDCIQALEDAIRFTSPDETSSEQAADIVDSGENVPEEDDERRGQGTDTGQLLDRLLYRGVLPRYAFPTDVATFHVFDQARSTAFRPIMRFAPSQGLPIALTQYAPGKQIWISGKCYSSGAIYSVMKGELYDAWDSKKLYSECSACGFARTYSVGQIERGSKQDCPACGSERTFGEARYWLEPPGFAHPVDVEEVTSPDDSPETSYATRAKLIKETPPDLSKWTRVNDQTRVLKEREHLLVSNTGPRRDGYSYCVKCGRIEATSDPAPLLNGPHRKPFPSDLDPNCPGDATARHIVLGTDFITDIALFSFRVREPMQLRPGHYPTDVALRTLSEAFAKAGSKMLGIEPGELMAEFRPALTAEGQSGLEAEIFVYDTLPGGAGFSPQLVARGQELLEVALKLVENCPERCDASCYRCLRSFKNKFEHGLLDRHVGAELLRYLLNGTLPHFDATRLRASTSLLANDLRRQGGLTVDYKENFRLAPPKGPIVGPAIIAERSDGRQFVIALAAPLTPQVAAEEELREHSDRLGDLRLLLVNELLVRGNLPAATREVQVRIGES